MFHRLTVPSYFGGLPAGYDYLNTPSLSGGSGTPAFADSKKSGGPNDGTYFVGFGEDATSNFANRGMKALGENTDILDNQMRRDLAVTARTADVTAGSPVSSVVLTGQIFVGQLGVANTQEERNMLISVLDDNDDEIMNSGTKVVAQAIVNNLVSSTNLVGTQASGFYSGPTVVFNTTIPAGVTYRIYYGERSNLASLPVDAFTTIKIRGAQEVTADVELLFLQLHSVFETDWKATWPINTRAVAYNGLDGMYRLNTTEPVTPVYPLNTPGGGAYIRRDGSAITLNLPAYNLSVYGSAAQPMVDSRMACFRLVAESATVLSTYNNLFGGDVGITQETAYHSVADGFEGATSRVGGPLLLEVTPRCLTNATLLGKPAITKINPASVATLNPDAGTSSGALVTIQLAPGDFLIDGSARAAIRSNDLIELTDNATDKIIGTFRMGAIVSTNRFNLRSLSGAIPAIGVSGVSTFVRVRWLQPTIQIGGRFREANGDSQALPNFAVVAPSPIVSDWNTNTPSLNALFLSAMTERQLGVANNLFYVSMAWGGYNQYGPWNIGGTLEGDGGITTVSGRQMFNLVSRQWQKYVVNNGGRTVSFNPYGGTHVTIYSNGALTTASPVAFTIDTSGGYVPTEGDEFDVFIVLDVGSTGPMTITWPGDFKFSGYADSVIPPTNDPGGPGNPITTYYRFKRVVCPLYTAWVGVRADL